MAGSSMGTRVVIGVQASLYMHSHRLAWYFLVIGCTPVQGYSGTIWQRQLDGQTRLASVVDAFCEDVILSREGCSLYLKGRLLSGQRTVRQVKSFYFLRLSFMDMVSNVAAEMSQIPYRVKHLSAKKVQADLHTTESLALEAHVHIYSFLPWVPGSAQRPLHQAAHHTSGPFCTFPPGPEDVV